jgi:predicted small metal-binding protein
MNNTRPQFLAKRFKTDARHVIVTNILPCHESGLDCDFVIKGETTEKFLRNGVDHAIQKRGMRAEDIYFNNIPLNMLCHSFNEED